MSPIARRTIIGGTVMAASAGLWMICRQSEPAPRAAETANVVRPKAGPPMPFVSSQGSSSAPELSTRALDLQKLKRRWMAGRPIEHMIRPEHVALAKESVESLLCSPELVELIEYLLKQPGMGGIEVAINDQVTQLFRSERAAEARQSLISLPGGLTRPDYTYCQRWSFDAGRGCPAEELDSFCMALGKGIMSQSARFGRNVALVKTDTRSRDCVDGAVVRSRWWFSPRCLLLHHEGTSGPTSARHKF